jgi:trehalose 6-phosphate phosphatase
VTRCWAEALRGERLNRDSQLEIEALMKEIRRSRKSLLMLDYDGTLAPFCPDRRKAAPYPEVADVLQAIADNGRTRVVIVSGRDAREIMQLLDVEPSPEMWGFHGLQRLNSDGSSELVPIEKETLEALASAERALRREGLQRAAEFKPGSIAMHWRGMAKEEAESLRKRTLECWTPLVNSSGLLLLEFNCGVEVMAPEANKGDAVCSVLGEMDAQVPAAYLGDDTTDEHAFQAMDEHGLSILIRSEWRSTSARAWLRPPGELLDFLNQWLDACSHPAPNHEASTTVNP